MEEKHQDGVFENPGALPGTGRALAASVVR